MNEKKAKQLGRIIRNILIEEQERIKRVELTPDQFTVEYFDENDEKTVLQTEINTSEIR